MKDTPSSCHTIHVWSAETQFLEMEENQNSQRKTFKSGWDWLNPLTAEGFPIDEFGDRQSKNCKCHLALTGVKGLNSAHIDWRKVELKCSKRSSRPHSVKSIESIIYHNAAGGPQQMPNSFVSLPRQHRATVSLENKPFMKLFFCAWLSILLS